MKIKFWGVRGSIPTPLTPAQVRRKIAAVVQRIESKDIVSSESRERFLSQLPSYIFGTVGGNTTCLEVRLDDGTFVIFDAGSGIRELGVELKKRREDKRVYHLFFTHFHWDHLQGLPFFAPLADPDVTVNFYSPDERFEEYVRGQMMFPYFPVTLDILGAKKHFHVLQESPIQIGDGTIRWRKMKHPGVSRSYCIIGKNNKKAIFSSDTELSEADFERSEENASYFADAEVLIMDSQYTLEEAIEKYDWGHSSYSLAVDFAAEWNIRNLILFHHEPLYEDQKMYNILKSARWYLNHLDQKGVKIHLAREGLELNV